MESKSIYHYCKLSTAIEYILPQKQLLLNNLGKANDPRENKNFVFAFKNISGNNYFDNKAHNAEISKSLRDGCKVLCLSSNDNLYFGYELSRLWALYGGNHTGVCIELNRDIFVQENGPVISNGHFKKVRYVALDVARRMPHKEFDVEQRDLIGHDAYIKQFRDEHIDHLFFTKNEEWESEKEHRVLYFSGDSKNEYCRIAKSLAGIYLGVDFNTNYLPSVKHLCSSVPIYKLEYDDVRLIRHLI